MITTSRSPSTASPPDTNQSTPTGRWSGMIPTILNLGMHEPAVEFDLAELNELFSMGIIDAPDDERQPELTTYGLAVFEYLTRL